MQARWVPSKDDKVKPRSRGNARINWEKDCNDYLGFILKGLNRRNRAILELMYLWNSKFYPDFERKGRTTTAPRRGAAAEDNARTLGDSWLDAGEIAPPSDEEGNSFTPPTSPRVTPSRQPPQSQGVGPSSARGPRSRGQPTAGPSNSQQTTRAGLPTRRGLRSRAERSRSRLWSISTVKSDWPTPKFGSTTSEKLRNP